jgi:hypothetical protein
MINYYQNQKEEIRRRRKIKVLALIYLFLLILVIGGVIYYLRSPYSKIISISVSFQPADSTLETSVKNSLENYLNQPSAIENVFFGKNNFILAWLKSSEIQKNIIDSFPIINSLTVVTDKIARTISLKANSREKFGLWCYETATSTNQNLGDNSKCEWFDNQGVAFSYGPNTEGQLIYKVLDNYDIAKTLGQKVVEYDYVPALLGMFKVLNGSGTGDKTLYMRSPELEELSTNPAISPVIIFSLRNNPEYALKAFNEYGSKILKSSQIDLRIPNRVYYK